MADDTDNYMMPYFDDNQKKMATTIAVAMKRSLPDFTILDIDVDDIKLGRLAAAIADPKNEIYEWSMNSYDTSNGTAWVFQAVERNRTVKVQFTDEEVALLVKLMAESM